MLHLFGQEGGILHLNENSFFLNSQSPPLNYIETCFIDVYLLPTLQKGEGGYFEWVERGFFFGVLQTLVHNCSLQIIN